MDEEAVKKLKIAGLVVVIVGGLTLGAVSMFGGSGPVAPVSSPKADALKEGYQKVEKPPETLPEPSTPPTRAPRQAGR